MAIITKKSHNEEAAQFCPRLPVGAVGSGGLLLLPRGSRMAAMFQPGQLVRVNLAGIEVQGVLFHAAVTDAVGNIVKQTSEEPPKFLVRLLFSFKGVNEVEVPAERIRAG
ncbi:MAG TPA: hypothetical protein VKE24_17225 [Candidatus Acidoferrales bacterium]|nr:hypothetical protein [Candidatus Acidoferrales bacterium]